MFFAFVRQPFAFYVYSQFFPSVLLIRVSRPFVYAYVTFSPSAGVIPLSRFPL